MQIDSATPEQMQSAAVMESAGEKLLTFLNELCPQPEQALFVLAAASASIVRATGDQRCGFRFVGVFSAIAAGDMDLPQ